MSITSTSTDVAKSLITEENVRKVLQSDKGPDAFMKYWKIVDFTKHGDNYTSDVTSIEVKYSKSCLVDENVTYIVKVNPNRNFGEFQEIVPTLFSKEGNFYEKILPDLNEILASSNQKSLRFPKCLLVSIEEEGTEQIYFEDLRSKGFKMFDRRKCLDKDHVDLIVSELARLNSASYLYKKKILEGKPAASEYEFLSKDYLTFSPNSRDFFIPLIERSLETGIIMLEEIGGYDTAISWLQSTKSKIPYFLSTGLQSERFNDICHGDCWINNFLFRYDEEGLLAEVMLVDAQNCREASVACDLNYLLYSSVSGDVRKDNLEYFLSLYHSVYKAVLEGADMPMHFTEEEIMEEFRSQNTYGLLFGILIVSEPDEVPSLTDTNIETFMQEIRTLALEKLNTDPSCKPRFLAMFDELMETGLIS